MTPCLTQSRRQLILAKAPSTPQISLPSQSGHITLRCCDFLAQLIFCDHPSALRRLPQWNFVLLAVKCHGVSRFIAREDPHSKCIKCLGFSHARDAVYGTSKCKICEDFRLITLRSWLEDCERESSIFPSRASSTSAVPCEIAASCEAMTWGLDVELEEMESEQTGLAFSLPPSPERVRTNSPVEFLHDFLFPSPRACDTVSFGQDDILHTAASDSEDFGPALADALPPSGQEARPSAAYSELVDVLSRATENLKLDWPALRISSWIGSKLDERFLSGAHSKPESRKLPFFSDLHREISRSWKQPFSSRLTNAAGR